MTDETYHGHITMDDGSHVPLTKEEAAAIWESAKQSRQKRAADMPDARSALSHIVQAEERLRELGWRKGVYCPKNGSAFAVAQVGSSGMWQGFYQGDWPDGYIIAGDEVNAPQGMYWKALADLTDEDRAHMESCDESQSGYLDRVARSIGADFEDEEPTPVADERDQIIRDLTMCILKLARHAPPEKFKPISDYLNRKKLSSPLRAALEPAPDHAPALAEALRTIERWQDFPETGEIGPGGLPLSFRYMYGSNGERDHMRAIARAALAAYDAASQTAPKTGRDDAQQTDSGGGQECG